MNNPVPFPGTCWVPATPPIYMTVVPEISWNPATWTQPSRAIPLAEALSSYIDTVLRHRRDEATMIAPPTESIGLPLDTGAIGVIDDDDLPTGSWRDKV